MQVLITVENDMLKKYIEDTNDKSMSKRCVIEEDCHSKNNNNTTLSVYCEKSLGISPFVFF